MQTLTPQQFALLRLSMSHGLGPVGIHKALHHYGSAEKALAALEISNKKSITIATTEACKKDCATLKSLGGFYIFWGDAAYPELLAQLPDAPIVLRGLGLPEALNANNIAIVGTRNASAIGCKLTHALAKDLAQANFCIVSGLARGIDTAAHKGALAGSGQTVAVVAGGVDHVYPPENKGLHQDIQKSGCIISEMPCGTPPAAHHFQRRNRIISGLSKAVAVMECSAKSGSLITARYAGEQSRDLFAMPNSPADPRSKGPNLLLKEGAMVLEDANDIINYYQSAAPHPQQDDLFTTQKVNTTPETAPTDLSSTILNTLSASVPISMDDIVLQTGQPLADVSIALVEMEILGQINQTSGGHYIKS